MKKQTRRAFVAGAVTLGSTTTASALSAMNQNKKQLIHHVYFRLKNRDSREDLNKLIEGLKTLEKIESVKRLHIGIPASTEQRTVVDSSYNVSELMFFDNVAGQDAYQVHPLHKKFVEQYSHLWERVVVYDSVDI